MPPKTKLKLDKSLACLERAKKRIPGTTQLLSKRPDQFSLGVWPTYFSKSSGAKVWDLDGNEYLDMSISGIGANVLGYCDPDVDAAVIEAVKSGSSSSLNCPEEIELADLLCELHPWADKVRYSRTGGEAMTIAVRIARAATKKDKVAFCGYHGWHDWYLAANLGTEDALGQHLLAGLNPLGVPKALQGTSIPFAYNRLDQLKTILTKNKGEVGAIVLEAIRGDEPTKEFLEGVRALATEHKAVLIVDEISSGFRLNTGGAHLLYGLTPDIAVFSKAMGNGYAIAAVIGKGSVMDAAEGTFMSSTYWTERIGPVAALATIRKHKRVDAAKHLVAIGRKVQAGWKDLSLRHGIAMEIGGIPPLSHFDFVEGNSERKALFIQLMMEENILAANSFYSMLTHTDAHVAAYLKAADGVFSVMKGLIASGGVAKALAGKPSNPGFKRLTS